VPTDRFRWVKGEDHGVTFALRPTYTITRCKTCGTPLPAELDAQNVYVTAGTLDVLLTRRAGAEKRLSWPGDDVTSRRVSA
jgi:hypothetical protein